MFIYATTADLNKIARCHVAAFPSSITSKLGVSVVESMLHWYLSAPNKFLFFEEENGKCLGYCGGYINDGRDSYGSSAGMTQFGFKKAMAGFLKRPWLLFHPEVVKKYRFIIVNTLRKAGLIEKKTSAPKPVEHPDQPLTAGLVVIGVLPNLQQKGLGTRLQQEFERKAIEMGAKQLMLSVRTGNEKAIRSYKRNGYEIIREQGPSFIMKKKLS